MFICIESISIRHFLTEGQWSYINEVFFENDCRKRKNSLRSLFEAVLYLLVTGCQWRMLPARLSQVATGVLITSESGPKEGRIEHLLNKLVRKVRKKRNQSESPSVGALDAQSVKWGNRKSDNGFDANKKVKGIKRNIVVDRNGFILARTVCSASVHDSHQAHPLCNAADREWNGLKRFLLDRVIEGRLLKILKKILQSALRFPILQTGLRDSYRNLSDGWSRELSHGFDWFRRLSRNYEESTEVAEEMIDLAAIKILLNQI